MKKTTIAFNRYKKSIVLIEKSNLKDLTILKQGIVLSRTCLNEFSTLVRTKKFPSKKEEITFFKYQKPYVEGRLQYFKWLHNYLLEKPISGNSKQQKYISNELDRLDRRKWKQLEFVKYYRLKEDKLDHLYFLRDIEQLDLFIDSSHHFKDPEFTTSHDYLVSKIIAHDLLIAFFSNELKILKNKKSNDVVIEEVKPAILRDLNWTGTKTDLVELIFALKESGVLRNGRAELKKIKNVIELLFEIELGNIYKVFEQIKAREKDQTKFIDSLKIGLINRIESN
ncbi:RteC domain-containing protein [Lutibacter sp. A64]|uniref:RteC domain-containing protein n=1 Tax=Lutibacter sp. A64 TaxID=2918526 RepID=UPI001F05BDEB|nr:RteC domain-containing protein [Lutibacter sp. A64]UMB52452.1 RteC domain-containing protein [Lutibacter sp. A64]